jgi:Domain of unknown function (DUF1707)
MSAVDPVSTWDYFSADPRQPDLASIRASDTDRVIVSDVLTASYLEGRLTREQYEDRSTRVAAIQTLGDIPALIGDLVLPVPSAVKVAAPSHARLPSRENVGWPRPQRVAAITGTAASLGTWTTWFLASYQHNADPGFPWPLLVTLGSGAYLALVRTQRRTAQRINPTP